MNIPKSPQRCELALAAILLATACTFVVVLSCLYLSAPYSPPTAPDIELGDVEEISQAEAAQWDSQNDPDAIDVAETSHQVHLPRGEPLPSRDEWIAKFNRSKRALIKSGKPLCEGCGRSPEACGKVSHDCHHQISVQRIVDEKLDESLKWDQSNMIILCRPSMSDRTDPDDKGCHFLLGHKGESWAVSDPNVRSKADAQFKRLHPGKSYSQLVEEYFEGRPILPPQTTKDRKRAKMPVKTGSQF